jgi:hypothetical protein
VRKIPAKVSVQGNREEVKGTNEILQFNQDGTVILDSPRTHNRSASKRLN